MDKKKLSKILEPLYDDNPITGLCIIEDLSKRPDGYIVVNKTFDQDSDADLWEPSLFGRRVFRYLCYTKSEVIQDYIVESLSVVGDKDIIPDGYSLIPRTIDGDSKAWRKKQICYRLTRRALAETAVSHIVLLSKYKKSMEGYTLAGEINGLSICYRSTTNIRQPKNGPDPPSYSLSPLQNGMGPSPVTSPGQGVTNGIHPQLPRSSITPSDEYVNLVRPIRPAPPTPTNNVPINNSNQEHHVQASSNCYGTLYSYSGLEGVPFVLHPKLKISKQDTPPFQIKAKSEADLDREYSYDFRTERLE